MGEVALRSSLVLAAVFLLIFAMKRASASERHLAMLFALLVVALVPVGLLVSPKVSWTISLPGPAQSPDATQKITAYFLKRNTNSHPTTFSSVVESKSSMMELVTFSNGLAVLLAAGMLMQALFLGRAAWSWRKIRREAGKIFLPREVLIRARNFSGAKQVPPVFISSRIAVPLLAGWLRPAIILPSGADQWPSERLLMVLGHELAHFRRGDFRLLPLICLLRVLYWWHPLVWLALVRLRRERENACDDLVLNQNVRASDYAELIVATARQAQALRWQDGVLAMASSSRVGERIRAILDPTLNRRPASRAMIFIGTLIALALGWFFVAVQVQAEMKAVPPDSTAAKNVSKPQVAVEFRVLQIDEETYLDKRKEIEKVLAKGEGSFTSNSSSIWSKNDIITLSRPSVTTQPELYGTIEMGTGFPSTTDLHSMTDLKCGKIMDIQIGVLPKLQADGQTIDLKFKCQVLFFKGWTNNSSGEHDMTFGTRSLDAEKLIRGPDYAWVGQVPGEKGLTEIALMINAHRIENSAPTTKK